MSARVKIKKYRDFIEDMENANIETEEDFKNWSGYKPSEKQKVLILARVKRELWTREKWKGKYVTVMRDKRGRFLRWTKWKRKH